jgi:hypothetical protein
LNIDFEISDNFFSDESVKIISILKYPFKNNLDESLNHGFQDLPNFPTWREFLNRSQKKNPAYKHYMTYLLCKVESNEIIGVLAVEFYDYELLKTKVHSIIPQVQNYLYLSWIALDAKFQKLNYFTFLFEFYKILIRRLRQITNTRVEGAAIIIRRMRKILWSFFNTNDECPLTVTEKIIEKSKKFTFVIEPCEIFDEKITLLQDHLLMLFDFSN